MPKEKDRQDAKLDADAFERELTTDLDAETPDKPKGLALHTRILIGLAVGVIAGVAVNWIFGGDHPRVAWVVDHITNPIGQLFLRLLLMIVVPLVFSSLVVGVAGIGDIRKLGRVGLEVVRLLPDAVGDFSRHRIDAGEHHQARHAHRPDNQGGAGDNATALMRRSRSRRRRKAADVPTPLMQVVETIVPSNPFAAISGVPSNPSTGQRPAAAEHASPDVLRADHWYRDHASSG